MENKLNDTLNRSITSGDYDSQDSSGEDDSDDIFSENITSSNGGEIFFERTGCKVKTINTLACAMLIILSVGIVLTSTTLLTIACNHRLRKKHFIFPFNIILADFVMNAVHIILCAGILMQVCLMLSFYKLLQMLGRIR